MDELDGVVEPADERRAFGQRRHQRAIVSRSCRNQYADAWLDAEFSDERSSGVASGHFPLFNEDRRAGDPGYAELRKALELGEGERIEFKPYVELEPRHEKSRELLHTAVAFANAFGGALYLGVTDDLTVEGVTRSFGHALRRRFKDDFAAMRDEYARTIRRVLTEGIDPPIVFRSDWIDHAGLWVLRVVIDEGSQKPHCIVETREIRVRRGANNVRPDTADLRQLFRREEMP